MRVGQTFMVEHAGQRVQIQVPPGVRGGQTIGVDPDPAPRPSSASLSVRRTGRRDGRGEVPRAGGQDALHRGGSSSARARRRRRARARAGRRADGRRHEEAPARGPQGDRLVQEGHAGDARHHGRRQHARRRPVARQARPGRGRRREDRPRRDPAAPRRTSALREVEDFTKRGAQPRLDRAQAEHGARPSRTRCATRRSSPPSTRSSTRPRRGGPTA